MKVGVENNLACGIIEKDDCPNRDEYRCCQRCKIKYTDDYDWGVENGEWCSIPYSCDSPNNKKPVENNETTIKNEDNSCPNVEGYPCCENCTILFSDDFDYSVNENYDWCVIPYRCNSPRNQKSLETQKCAAAGKACGGSSYPNAPNCCEKGYYCRHNSSYFHQCVKICADEGEVCGGTDYPDAPNCCKEGLHCNTDNASKFVCRNNMELCQGPGDICGGVNFPNASYCCTEGYVCKKANKEFYTCQ